MDLSCAFIFARNLECMTAFYRDGIGLRFVPDRSNDVWAEFDLGSLKFALHAIPHEIAKGIEITDPPKARTQTPMKLIFGAPDLEAARTHLIAHGAVMFDQKPWGGYDGLDPEGNVFQIVQA